MNMPAWTRRVARGDLQAGTEARREFARLLRERTGRTPELAEAVVVFGELVTNAVRCAASEVRIELLQGGWAKLKVSDDGKCFTEDRIHGQPNDAECGRGLQIVKALSRSLVVEKKPPGCVVTAQLPLRI